MYKSNGKERQGKAKGKIDEEKTILRKTREVANGAINGETDYEETKSGTSTRTE